ncbi:hypothetical protein MNBD_BACTEROID05-483 [hydrothermal vent metagenome]|uniref:Uncharacterized protein n=1 Tax=hydrothermal vent metagenome TaxID=652676 RepID=A0A3B0U1L3_9ZZZZ
MKKSILLVALLVFVVGCESKKEVAQETSSVKKNYIAQGFALLDQKNIKGAIASFDLAIKQDPRNVDNYITLGQVYLKLNNASRAIDSFTAATKVSPTNGEAHQLLATALGLRNENESDRKGAIAAAQRSAEIFMNRKDQLNFKKSLSLVKSLEERFQ